MAAMDLRGTDDAWTARLELASPADGYLPDATKDQMNRHLGLAAAVFLVACGALALTFVDPCIWAGGGTNWFARKAECAALPYSEQVTHSLLFPFLFLGVSVLSVGLPGLRYFVELVAGAGGDLAVAADERTVVAALNGVEVYRAARADTKLVVESSTLVLIRRSDETMVEWKTRASPTALRKLVTTMGGDAAVLP